MVLSKLLNNGIKKFDNLIISNGFEINMSNEYVYSKRIGDQVVIMCLYVDDILIFGTNMDVIQFVKDL